PRLQPWQGCTLPLSYSRTPAFGSGIRSAGGGGCQATRNLGEPRPMPVAGGDPMDRIDSDPSYVPAPVRLARPLIQGFCRSRHCPPEHRWHARSTLPVLALFVGMIEEPSSRGLAWEALDPDALLRASLEVDPDERAFLRDLL